MAETAQAAGPKAKELAVLEAPAQVTSLRFSHCGRMLAAADYEGAIRRWEFPVDPASEDAPLERELLTGHRGWATRVAWLRNGTLLSCDSWGGLMARAGLEDAAEPNWKHEEAHDGWIHALAVSAEENLLATAGADRMLRLWNPATGERLREIGPLAAPLVAAALEPAGDFVVVGDAFGKLFRFETATGQAAGERELTGMHYYDRIQDVPGLFGMESSAAGLLLAYGGRPTRIQNHHGHPVVYRLNWANDAEPEVLFLQEVENNGFVFDCALLESDWLIAVTSGAPGNGQLLVHRPLAEKPEFLDTRMANCHALAVQPGGGRVVVAATNRNSQGNGAVRDKEGNYLPNYSPLHVFRLEQAG